jgi:hypothetical protein
MSWLVLLLACGEPSELHPTEQALEPVDIDPTSSEPAPTQPWVPEPAPTVDIDVKRVDSQQLKVAIAGFAAKCSGEEAWVFAEYVGPATELVATPYVDGQPGAPVPLEPAISGVIRSTDTTATVADCGRATWHLEVVGPQRSRCALHGPDRDALAAAHADCTLW